MKKNANAKWDPKKLVFYHADGKPDPLIVGASGHISSNCRLKWVNMWGFKVLNYAGTASEIIGDT